MRRCRQEAEQGRRPWGGWGLMEKTHFPAKTTPGPPGSSEPERLQRSKGVPPSTAAAPLSQAL